MRVFDVPRSIARSYENLPHIKFNPMASRPCPNSCLQLTYRNLGYLANRKLSGDGWGLECGLLWLSEYLPLDAWASALCSARTSEPHRSIPEGRRGDWSWSGHQWASFAGG